MLVSVPLAAVIVSYLWVRRRYLRSEPHRRLRRLEERLAAARKLARRLASEGTQRKERLDAAYRRLTRAQFERLWRAVPLDELRCKGIGAGALSALRSAGVRQVASLPSDSSLVSGIGPQKGMLLDQRRDYLRRCTNDQVSGEPDPSLAAHHDRDVVRAAVEVLEINEAWPGWASQIEETVAELQRGLDEASATWSVWRFWRQGEAGLRADVRAVEASWNTGELWPRCRAMTAAAEADLFARACGAETDELHRVYAARKIAILDLLVARYQRHKLRGGIAEEVARKVEATRFSPVLKEGFALRPYQVFGGKFMLCQRRVLLGDEMGLGKTLQALSLATHIKAERGRVRAMYVVPASLTENWKREVKKFTTLRSVEMRGSEVGRAVRHFIVGAEVAVITYETTYRGVLELLPAEFRLDLLVVDEAHYIKNPGAKRTKATRKLMERADRVVLMTGTPIENHPKEMLQLLRSVQPDLVARMGLSDKAVEERLTPSEFTERVSPAYLRRKTVDVLRELPERVEVEEWVELSSADIRAYRTAIECRRYADARRAVTVGERVPVRPSAKVERLLQIVAECEGNGRKVLVFSFYLDVLGTLQDALGRTPAGRRQAVFRVDGSVAPKRRQETIDAYSEMEGSAVLLAQITSAGTGLNIQAASVVVIMEPQFKPSIESQAIARAHRMGQQNVVNVYRMLALDSIDERLHQRLLAKSAQVALYADESRLKAVSPDAVKLEEECESEEAFARRFLEEEATRLQLEVAGGARRQGGGARGSASGQKQPEARHDPARAAR